MQKQNNIAYTVQFYLENSFIFSSNTFAFIMDRKDSVDIDTQIDLEFCEFYINKNK